MREFAHTMPAGILFFVGTACICRPVPRLTPRYCQFQLLLHMVVWNAVLRLASTMFPIASIVATMIVQSSQPKRFSITRREKTRVQTTRAANPGDRRIGDDDC